MSTKFGIFVMNLLFRVLKASYKINFKLPLYLHWSLLIPLLTNKDITLENHSYSGWLITVFVFVSIYLHELGHVYAAKMFNIKTSTIFLSLIGGVASLEKEPRQGWQEFVVAIGGPLVTLILALIGYICAPLHYLFILLFVLNILLFVFNMLPLHPMDGGRILRSILFKIAPRHSEHISALIAFIGGILMFFIPIFGSTYPILASLLILTNYEKASHALKLIKNKFQ